MDRRSAGRPGKGYRAFPGVSRSKYGNRKATYDGIQFDSIRELNRYAELKILEKAGQIADLHLQVPFELIPAQKNEAGKVAERALTYVADFTYRDRNGRFIVEDAKGCKTEVYRIKKKLMRWVHGIEIREV